MNLFEQNSESNDKNRPLAYRMRPGNLDEFYGQEDVIGPGKPLRRAIEADRVQSLILYGPPGCGKTSLAQVIARKTEGKFIRINAVTSGVSKIREVIDKASKNRSLHGIKTILFIDEIHRFNKSQQDALLPAVESGTITLIGATTENPYFEVNSPLLSRSRIVRLKPLKKEDIIKILKNALNNEERGLGNYNIDISQDALQYLASIAGGDARTALNGLEIAVLTTPPDKEGIIHINKNIISESLQKKLLKYDKQGDNHYDVVSAFIKSMRGSDPDAALFWLARMLESGEDPRFIARRIIVHAAEDVGMADPMALVVATSAANAVEYVGLPEARIPLAEAVIYIATAPKSNSVITGIDAALNYVKNNDTGEVPLHLRDAHYKGARNLKHGLGYKYPHDYPYHYVKQQYVPDEVTGTEFYKPGQQGREKKIKQRLDFLKNLNSNDDVEGK
ncbi:replication-associated recombination protein A [Halothermothrix orenii]|uniref:replication-associated recombination protein A n=1 Tax=Halothermothrix orenii TaxID=31909 RepID=UPI00059F49BA|nr:replication-associated recombination protein A [Halothermothrix orenii]